MLREEIRVEVSSMSNVFRLYRDLFRRRPATLIIAFVITTGVYAYILAQFGIINFRLFSKPTITVQLEATESYVVGAESLALKRVRLVSDSSEPIEKITTTIEAPKFVSEVKLLSRPTADAHFSEYESSYGRKRYEILCRSVASKQELVIVLVGTGAPGAPLTDPPSQDTAVIVEVVASTKGRLFGASAIGEFSLRDSEQTQSSRDDPLR